MRGRLGADDNIAAAATVVLAFFRHHVAFVVVDAVDAVLEPARRRDSPERCCYCRWDFDCSSVVVFRGSWNSSIAPRADGRLDNIRSFRARRRDWGLNVDKWGSCGPGSLPRRSGDDDDNGCCRIGATGWRWRSMESVEQSRASSSSCCNRLDRSACVG